MRENLLGDTSQDSQTFVKILILSYEKLAMNDKCLECLFKFLREPIPPSNRRRPLPMPSRISTTCGVAVFQGDSPGVFISKKVIWKYLEIDDHCHGCNVTKNPPYHQRYGGFFLRLIGRFNIRVVSFALGWC